MDMQLGTIEVFPFPDVDGKNICIEIAAHVHNNRKSKGSSHLHLSQQKNSLPATVSNIAYVLVIY